MPSHRLENGTIKIRPLFFTPLIMLLLCSAVLFGQSQNASLEGQVLDKIKGLMGLVSAVILILSSLCVNTTLMAIVGERSREFALQKALGASARDITLQMLAETGIIALAAVVCGVIIGFVLAQILGHAVFNAAIALRAPVLPLTLVLSLLVAAVAAIVPVRRALHVVPASVLKGE